MQSPKSKRCWLLLQHLITLIQTWLQQCMQMRAAMGLVQFFCKSTQTDSILLPSFLELSQRAKESMSKEIKKCLASTWVCKKFDRYLVGLHTFSVVTDHKPFVPLINTNDLSETPWSIIISSVNTPERPWTSCTPHEYRFWCSLGTHCVHHTTMHYVTLCKARYVGCMYV